MLTRTSERIFNPMHCTADTYDYAHSYSERIFNPLRYAGNIIYDYVHSFLGEDFKSTALCW